MNKRGLLFVCTGEKYVSEAIHAAEKLRDMSSKPIAVVTDIPDRVPDSFDYIIKNKSDSAGPGVKIRNLKETPFQRTVYLDTDTYVEGCLDPLFSLLDRFELAAAVKPDNYERLEGNQVSDIPATFAEPNTGVISYRSSVIKKDFFTNWDENYKDSPSIHDQPSFRKTVYDNMIQYHTLRPEWNCRFTVPGQLCREAIIFHGRPWKQSPLGEKRHIPRGTDQYDNKMKKVVNKLNSSDLPRVHWPTWKGTIKMRTYEDPFQVLRSKKSKASTNEIMSKSIENRGFFRTLKNMLSGKSSNINIIGSVNGEIEFLEVDLLPGKSMGELYVRRYPNNIQGTDLKLPEGRSVLQAYYLKQELVASGKVRLRVKYSDSQIGKADEQTLQIRYRDTSENRWIVADDIVIDTKHNVVNGTLPLENLSGTMVVVDKALPAENNNISV